MVAILYATDNEQKPKKLLSAFWCDEGLNPEKGINGCTCEADWLAEC